MFNPDTILPFFYDLNLTLVHALLVTICVPGSRGEEYLFMTHADRMGKSRQLL